MKPREYYSVRTRRIDHEFDFDLETLRDLFFAVFSEFKTKGYFQEHIGTDCEDGWIDGIHGDIQKYAFKRLRRPNLFPLRTRRDDLSEDEIFDLVEFLYDHISTPDPASGYYHRWNGCGYHYESFSPGNAREEFRSEINVILRDYQDGFELSPDGEILTSPGDAMRPMFDADVPTSEDENIRARVDAAVRKFRLRSSSYDDRRHAVRDLADVLEFLRPQLKQVLTSKDESDLFNIANNFAIRHHNQNQKGNYDERIWLSWMFYFFLATVHAALRLIERDVGVDA